MTTERDDFLPELHAADYLIADNGIRAYYDNESRLVCVIDYAILPDKPNVLLVMDKYDDRKWDDVLSTDYGVDLETIRPKKDNKYQKLDIEYSGLVVYDALISAYRNGDDLTDALGALTNFRHDAVRNSATERLAAAEVIMENANDTILRTRETIDELNDRIKQMRAKLATARRQIGKEPTKQSASKILRAEAQIDQTNEKLSRAQRRLRNAEKRMVAAENDADAARELLATIPMATPAPVFAQQPLYTPAPEFHDIEQTQGTNEMAEDDVKPLFDQDPNIVDEEKAFQPIFNPPASPAATNDDTSDSVFAPMPLSFPTPKFVSEPEPNIGAPETTPVINTIRPVEAETATTPVPAPAQPTSDAPVQPAPIMPTPVVAPEPAPAPQSPQNNTPVARPVSPITGRAVAPVDGGGDAHKPTFMYYMLLVVLILLSILTLWLYQRSTSDTIPDITTVNTVAEEPEPVATPDSEIPFVDTTPADDTPIIVTEPEPVTVTEPEPTPAPIVVIPEPTPEPEPVAAPEPEPTPAPVIEPAPETPFVSEPVPEPEPVVEKIINKPAYNVSQNDEMFVASPDYDNTPPAAIADLVPPEPTPVIVSNEPQIVTAEDYEVPMCSDGNAPDIHGCCAGEEFAELADGPACCVIGTDECFPPME